jgi:hypothetical protein
MNNKVALDLDPVSVTFPTTRNRPTLVEIGKLKGY